MIRHPLIALGVGILLSSCAPTHPADVRAIDSLRARAETLVEAQSLMGYNNWAYGTPSNQDSLYHAYAGLFTRENIALTRRAEEEEADSVQKRRLQYFLRYLTLEFLSQEVAPLSDSIATAEARSVVTLAGEEIPYRQIAVLMANEPRQMRRAALYTAADSVLDALNPARRQLWGTYYRLARELGYPSYSAMISELKGIPLDEMRTMALFFLSSTDSLYRALLPGLIRRTAGLDTADFYRYDTPLLFRVHQFDPYYPKSELLPTAERMYRRLGFDLASMTNLTIDTAARAEKNPRAACFAIQVPGDIRVTLKPAGGFDDFAALFHELGHAQHYANTTEHALEFRTLGEYTVTETYAFLSEYLPLNQAWLRASSRMSVNTLKDFVRIQTFNRLYIVRRYCAKLLYELELHAGLPDPGNRYASLLASAAGYQRHPSDATRYLVDVDEHFYTATYLRGWFLEAQLNKWLSTTYGPNWYEHPGAGAFLQSLWAKGDRLTGDELSVITGCNAIRPDELISEIRDMLRFSSR